MTAPAFLLFGAHGDLALRMLWPSLFRLHCDGSLPPEMAVFGVSRSGTTAELHAHLRKALAEELHDGNRDRLEGFLAKTAFINAEILLKRNYPIVLQQVEDKECYEDVGSLMGKLFGGGCSPDEYARTKAELDSLQDKRTAVMLQKIPEIIDREYEEGRIKTRKAIFTIGLSHIPPLLKYLNDGGIRFSSPHAGNHNFQELNLHREKFRVSILIPKSLAEDPKVLDSYNLERIVSGTSSSRISPQRQTTLSP